MDVCHNNSMNLIFCRKIDLLPCAYFRAVPKMWTPLSEPALLGRHSTACGFTATFFYIVTTTCCLFQTNGVRRYQPTGGAARAGNGRDHNEGALDLQAQPLPAPGGTRDKAGDVFGAHVPYPLPEKVTASFFVFLFHLCFRPSFRPDGHTSVPSSSSFGPDVV